jgi:PAS domain S-box-containing protein
LFLLVGAIALVILRWSVGDAHTSLLQAQDVVNFGQFQTAFNRKLVAARAYLVDKDEAALHQLVASRTEALAELARVEQRARAEDLQNLRAVHEAEETHQKFVSAAVALRRSGGPDEEVAKAFTSTLLYRDPVLAATKRFLETRERALREAEGRTRRRGEISFAVLIGAAVIAFASTLVFSSRLSRRFDAVYDAERKERLRTEAAAAALAESEARFRPLYDSGMIGICFPDLTGKILDANDAFLEMVGHTRAELESGEVHWMRMTAPESVASDEKALEEIRTTGVTRPYEKEYVLPGGERRSVLIGGSLLPGSGGRAVMFALDITARKRIEAERVELLKREREARAVAEAAQRRSAYLAHASEALAQSLDYRSTLQAVARLAVPDISDWCLIDVMPDGVFRRVAVSYSNPARAEIARRLEEQGLLDPQSRMGPPQVLRSGESELLTWVTDEMLRTIARTPRALDMLREMNIASAMTVAIRNAQGIVGIVTFLSAESGRRFGTEDLRLAEDLAVRAGVAMENARLFEMVHQERAAAEWHERRSAFLARASEILASSLDYKQTLASVARLAVPEIADWCLVDMLQADGTIESIAIEHSDSSHADLLRRVNRKYPYEPEQPYGPPHVLKTGDPELGAMITDQMIRDSAKDDEHYEILKGLGFHSYMCVPLQVRGRTLGAITFLAAESSRRYEPDDLALGEALAYRAGLAIDNARLHAEALDAIRVRDEFLSIASHELKTPITTLQLQIQSLLRRADGGAIEGLGTRLGAAERQVERLTGLINDLLDISRITGGRLDLSIEEVDLAGVVRDVTARMEEQLARAGCPLKLSSPEAQRGKWDRLRLDQIVTNLLSNAMKYGAGQPIEITVAGSAEAVRLEVRDHGIGIAPENQSRIFDRFERAVSGRNYGGLGLGLWIVRQIVDALGGSIRVRSAAGEGSTFVVELPRVQRQTQPGIVNERLRAELG